MKTKTKRAKMKELEKAFKAIDPEAFWRKIMEKVIPEVEAYERARAKSRESNFVVI
jgi:hypothetical protein